MERPAEDYQEELINRLKDERYCLKYLQAAARDSLTTLLAALRNAAEARKGMTKLSAESGVHRVNLYRMLSPEGNPTVASLAPILGALGLRLVPESVASHEIEPPHGPSGDENAVLAAGVKQQDIRGAAEASCPFEANSEWHKGMASAASCLSARELQQIA